MTASSGTYPLLPHFLQGSAWMEVQRAMDREIIERSGEGWSYRAVLETGRVSRRLYCPYGPTITSQAALKEALKDLHQQAREKKATFVRIEPLGAVSAADLEALSLIKSERSVQPPDTLVKTLAGTEDEILLTMSKSVRSSWRSSKRKGVNYRVSTSPSSVDELVRLLDMVAERTGMAPHDSSYFRKVASTLMPLGHAAMILAEVDGQCVASTLIYYNDSCGYYAHAAADYEFRKLQAASGVVVEAVLFAASQGCRAFDFFGVAPEDAPKDHPWAGFTRFKATFGGDRKHSVGTYELPVNALKYRLYRAALKAATLVRKR